MNSNRTQFAEMQLGKAMNLLAQCYNYRNEFEFFSDSNAEAAVRAECLLDNAIEQAIREYKVFSEMLETEKQTSSS